MRNEIFFLEKNGFTQKKPDSSAEPLYSPNSSSTRAWLGAMAMKPNRKRKPSREQQDPDDDEDQGIASLVPVQTDEAEDEEPGPSDQQAEAGRQRNPAGDGTVGLFSNHEAPPCYYYDITTQSITEYSDHQVSFFLGGGWVGKGEVES